ncbi:hypothetical protein DSCO28_15440 [Desulfosarcina ovata subsp. sediminis]|uniref:3-hydroxy-3-methylglutaryl CoA synthase n=1 Tax=Desulfosarcina ovata subsp. sediminis TaxID=885957 RepID=A0A5K7ZFP1_9BACT|nr:hypothetical protein [Desulfosarcina ovata]BBO80978.1 hypothetical protein DSCO28_15440 [Desulfosarcina ovata subsp. sediminis]
MVGIVAFGGYIPFYRLRRDTIGAAWGKNGGRGEKAVAGSDEDSVTLATEAVLNSLVGVDREEIDNLYFASTRPPYAQKQSASIVAAACNLREDVVSMDVGNSLRSGTLAMRAALDAVKSGSARQTIAVAAECQIAPGDSAAELAVGDGAAAVVLGSGDAIATVEHALSTTSDFLDVWRLPEDRYNQSWEDRFVLDEGYIRLMREAMDTAVKRFDLDLADFTRVVYNAPDARSHGKIAKMLKIDAKTQLQDPLYGTVGNTGTANALLMLVAVLEQSKAGDRILLANYADGVDVFVIDVQRDPCPADGYKSIDALLAAKMMIPDYGKYLHLRDMMAWEVDRRPAARTSLPILFRERAGLMRLVGKRCNACGHEQFPRTRICMWCQTPLGNSERYTDVWLKPQTGPLFSFNMDVRADTPDLPNVNCVVDLSGGARFYGLMTDRDPEKIEIGMPMEFTFRKINDAQGMHNYFWKVRPIRG